MSNVSKKESDVEVSKKYRKVSAQAHHVREELCQSRAAYRRGKRETAVKVFTVADESFYLLIQNVPSLSGVNVSHELKSLCYRYGNLTNFEQIEYEFHTEFCHTYLVKYENLADAICGKKRMDDYEFLGSTLHVCYAPELETVSDTQNKLNSRMRYVSIKVAQCKNLASRNETKRRKINSESNQMGNETSTTDT